MKKRLIGVCLLAMVLVGGVGAGGLAASDQGEIGVAVRPLRMFLSGQFGRLMTLRSELNITPEQRDQIRQIVQRHHTEIASVTKPVVEKRRALRAAALAEHPEESAIRAAAKEFGMAIGDAAVVGLKIKADAMKVMTPGQKQKISEFREQADAAVDGFMLGMANPS